MTTEVKAELPVIKTIQAKDFVFDCPKCGEPQEAWIKDPRGLTEKCDQCGQAYRVADDATITAR